MPTRGAVVPRGPLPPAGLAPGGRGGGPAAAPTATRAGGAVPGRAVAVDKALLMPGVRAAMGVPPLGPARPPAPAAKPAAATSGVKRKARASAPAAKVPKIPAAPAGKRAPAGAPPAAPATAMKAMKAVKSMKVMKRRPRLRPPAQAAAQSGMSATASEAYGDDCTTVAAQMTGDVTSVRGAEIVDNAADRMGLQSSVASDFVLVSSASGLISPGRHAATFLPYGREDHDLGIN